jgi:glycosyltransferase involved in cell wall biosynthesis
MMSLGAGRAVADSGAAVRHGAQEQTSIDRSQVSACGARILALMPAESISGPGRQLVALAAPLRQRDLELRVILFHRVGRPRPPFAAYLEQHGVEFDIVPDRGPLDRQIVAATRALLSERGADIIQTHGYKATAVAWALRRSGERRPWIGFFHGETTESLAARFYHRLDRVLLGSADRIVVMSDQQARRFARFGSRVVLLHNAVIPLPIQPEGDESRQLTERLKEMARPRLGVVGRLSREKGVDIFLHACARLLQTGRTFSAAIVGEGNDRASLEVLASRLDLGDRVRFLGVVNAMPLLYQELDLLVIPSRSEGLPNVLLEALSADLPVVATAVGAIPDVLQDPLAGRVVPAGSIQLLADAMVDSIDERVDDRRQAGADDRRRAARRTVAHRFSLDRRADLHAALYAAVLDQTATGDNSRAARSGA